MKEVSGRCKFEVGVLIHREQPIGTFRSCSSNGNSVVVFKQGLALHRVLPRYSFRLIASALQRTCECVVSGKEVGVG